MPVIVSESIKLTSFSSNASSSAWVLVNLTVGDTLEAELLDAIARRMGEITGVNR
jgi:hypothetical protein